MPFTSILGKSDSKLGNIVLGLGSAPPPAPQGPVTGTLGDLLAPALLGNFVIGLGAGVSAGSTVQFTSAVTLTSIHRHLNYSSHTVTFTSAFSSIQRGDVASTIGLSSTFVGTKIVSATWSSEFTLSNSAGLKVIKPASVANGLVLSSTFVYYVILNPAAVVITDRILGGGLQPAGYHYV